MSEPPYEVGHGRPPKGSQFAKGVSGNPAGRPKGAKGVREIVTEELLKEVRARGQGEVITLPAIAAIARTLVTKAIQGDAKLGIMLVDLGLRLDAGAAPDDDDADRPEDSEIIAAALARSQKGGGNG
jgi:hypothetical protein